MTGLTHLDETMPNRIVLGVGLWSHWENIRITCSNIQHVTPSDSPQSIGEKLKEKAPGGLLKKMYYSKSQKNLDKLSLETSRTC